MPLIGKLSGPYIHLNGLAPGIKVSSSGIANGAKLASSLFSGKGLSLGLGLGLGAWGPMLIAGAVCAVGYGAFRVYKDNPKIRTRRAAKTGNAEGGILAEIFSFADEIYDSSIGAFNTLIAPADTEAELAAKLAAEIALVERLTAEANTAERRSLAAGNSAKQSAKMAAVAKRRAKAALDALHSTEAQMALVLASKRRANPAGSKP